MCANTLNGGNELNTRRLTGLSILLAGLVLYTGQGWADSWQHAVSSRVSTEYDTNPAMSSAYPGSVWRALFEPSYTLIGRMGADELKAGLALQIARSSNKTLSQDRDGPSAFLDWLRQSDVGEFGISSRYAEIATRDAGIDATGLVPVDSTRASSNLSGSWSKELSERSTLSVHGSYEDISYKGGTYTNYVTQSGGLRYSYAWSESSTPFLMVSGEKYEPAGGGPTSRLANATLGLNWKAEYVDLTVQMGQSRSSGGNTDLQGAFAAQYTGQRNQLALNADRQVSSSGLGGFVKADHMRGSWSYALSEHSNTGIDLDWRKNRSITTNNIRTTAGAWLQRNLNSLWGVRTYYRRSIIAGDATNGASSNMLGLSLVYTHSDF